MLWSVHIEESLSFLLNQVLKHGFGRIREKLYQMHLEFCLIPVRDSFATGFPSQSKASCTVHVRFSFPTPRAPTISVLPQFRMSLIYFSRLSSMIFAAFPSDTHVARTAGILAGMAGVADMGWEKMR